MKFLDLVLFAAIVCGVATFAHAQAPAASPSASPAAVVSAAPTSPAQQSPAKPLNIFHMIGVFLGGNVISYLLQKLFSKAATPTNVAGAVAAVSSAASAAAQAQAQLTAIQKTAGVALELTKVLGGNPTVP